MNNTERTIRVWDPVVRIGHWLLVIAFFTAYFTEEDLLTQHVWAGYVTGAVVALRIVWGLLGPEHARFSDFIYSPAVIMRYLGGLFRREAARHIGHSPAGGAMVVALLLGMVGTVYSGLVIYAIEENAGPLSNLVSIEDTRPILPALVTTVLADEDDEGEHDDEAREEFWEEQHELFANLTLLLVVLHVSGVLLTSYVHKENLVKSMIIGRKRSE